MLNLGALVGVNLLIGAVFVWLGYPLVTVCCALVSIAVVVAGLFYGLHATDGEVLELGPDMLRVEVYRGLTTHCAQFNPRWTRVEQRNGSVHLCSGRDRVEVGRYLSLAERGRFAADLGGALAVHR